MCFKAIFDHLLYFMNGTLCRNYDDILSQIITATTWISIHHRYREWISTKSQPLLVFWYIFVNGISMHLYHILNCLSYHMVVMHVIWQLVGSGHIGVFVVWTMILGILLNWFSFTHTRMVDGPLDVKFHNIIENIYDTYLHWYMLNPCTLSL